MYDPALQKRILKLVESGRSPRSLAKEFQPTEQTIYNWIRRSEMSTAEALATKLLKEAQQELKLLEEEREILAKAAAWFASPSSRKDLSKYFEFIQEHLAEHSLQAFIRALPVSRSGYYAWLNHKPSAREQENLELREHIRRIQTKSKGKIGANRIQQELQKIGRK